MTIVVGVKCVRTKGDGCKAEKGGNDKIEIKSKQVAGAVSGVLHN